MIENSTARRKHDRLRAFMQAFPLRAEPGGPVAEAHLFIMAGSEGDAPERLIYRPRAGGTAPAGRVLEHVRLDFGGSLNPLVGALPAEIAFELAEEPDLRALAGLALGEETLSRCGSGFAGERLCEVIVVHAVRRAIARGTATAGLLAGLAHPELHPCLVAMHDDPARDWRVGDLAALAGMSRSRFLRAFAATVGQSPIAYLAGWRLTLARALLADGGRIKPVAAQVGFGSAAAFSRAFSRQFGIAPSQVAPPP
ncbi:helix-turn-helix transcriptional regulator [Poseidonocella sp. HB161398]|uniref:helix-turn-helix transcriptional regulator n=1 Tax=Poseidonocella sp. HB161398 TaxID=2320855 RepID=UPI00110976F6|nr:helix-turn-helix transcriptional regulator [Poseidonocella sp. HB161398]